MAKVRIRRLEGGEVVHEIEVGTPSWRQHERFLAGLVAKLRSGLYVDDSEVEIREGETDR